MATTTVSIDNRHKPAPRWFRKLKKAIGVIVITLNAMVASWPKNPDPLLVAYIQLWTSIGIGAILEVLEIILANGEEYAPSEKL